MLDTYTKNYNRGGMQAAFRGLSAGVQRTRVGESADIVFTDTERNNSAR
jgi:hypothetical protein